MEAVVLGLATVTYTRPNTPAIAPIQKPLTALPPRCCHISEEITPQTAHRTTRPITGL
jgi:hypothetical protein